MRKEFFASGGVSLLFLPPVDSPLGRLKVPPVARKMVPGIDVDSIIGQLQALANPFQKKSKELYGQPYEDQLGYEGWLFLYPLLRATHFFSLPEQEISKLFELAPIYVNESPEDGGILIASKDDLRPVLNAAVRQLEDKNMPFPSRL